MSDPLKIDSESDIALFDVLVKMPPGARLEDIERLGRDAGVKAEHLDTLVKILRSSPQAKIGSGVPRDRADKAKAQFTAAGLIVEITPLLSIQTKTAASFDGRYFCPACRAEVTLPDNRQCPACGVFVDKVTDEFLLKRKIMEQERYRIESKTDKDIKETEKRNRELRESSFREQIRKELEEEYGINNKGGFFSGKVGLLRGAGVVGLLAAAFVGGQFSPSIRGLGGQSAIAGTPNSSKAATPADVDKMLDKVGPKTAAEAESAGATGDADIDDPLIQAAGGKRIGAKGLTMEQAVAAAQTLGKSVGNTAGQNGPGGAGRSAGPNAAGGGSPAANQSGAGGTVISVASSTGNSSGNSAQASASVSAQTKIVLTAEFSRRLAELGQVSRAREVLKALKASPGLAAEPGAAAAVRIAEMEVHAWAMQAMPEGRARAAADSLKSGTAAMADAAERTQALARVAAILSQHPQLPPEASRVFLTLAAESLKSVPNGPQRVVAMNDWVVSLGEVLLADVTARAKAGAWSKAQAAGAQLEALIKQAPDASSAARLHAFDYQAQQVLGQPDKANHSLDAALALASKVSNLKERAGLLRSIAQVSRAATHEKLQAAITALAAQLERQSGLEKAQAFTQISLLFSDAGLRDKSGFYGRLAQATTGLSPQDETVVNADLIVYSDLSSARALHGAGLYAESEVVLQRLGNYLL